MNPSLTPFKGWVLENFPFIEEDMEAIDNYQLLCKIVEYMNKIADSENDLSSKYYELVDGFEELKNYVDAYLTGLDEVKEAIILINNSLDALTLKVNKNTQDISDNYTYLYNLIGETYDSLKTYVDNQVLILNNKIDNIQIGQISIYDPTTGLLSPLQTVINNIYEISNKDGLTASEFDALNLTASGFDAYQITAYEFDSQGKTILV